MKKITAYSITALLLSVLASCSNPEGKTKDDQPTETKEEITKVIGIARIEPEKGLLYVYSNANGKIESINAEENAIVKQDEILISLEQATDQAQLTQEKSKISAQQSAIKSAEENANAIQSDLQKAREDVTLNEKLFAVQGISEQSLNDSKAKVSKLLFEYNKQLADVGQSKNKMSELHANIRYRNALIAEKQIKAAFDGKVLQWDVQKGDYITAGQKLGQFAPEGPLVAVTEVDELFAEKVTVGMKAEIISQLNSEKIGEGEIVFVADFLKKKSLFSDETTIEDRRVKEVKIRLNADSKIAINNRVDCIIKLN